MEKSACNALEIHTIVKGRVQGVGFRATTKYYAMHLGITGTVRNLKDGSVEIYAQGSKQMIEELFQRLKAEFESAKIEVEGIEYFPVVNPMEDFQIIH